MATFELLQVPSVISTQPQSAICRSLQGMASSAHLAPSRARGLSSIVVTVALFGVAVLGTGLWIRTQTRPPQNPLFLTARHQIPGHHFQPVPLGRWLLTPWPPPISSMGISMIAIPTGSRCSRPSGRRGRATGQPLRAHARNLLGWPRVPDHPHGRAFSSVSELGGSADSFPMPCPSASRTSHARDHSLGGLPRWPLG